MMIQRSAFAFLLLPIVSIISLSGCQPALPRTSPERAHAAVREALEAWRKGETTDEFRNGSSITVVERKWRDGFRLLGYEVVGDGRMNGFDWECRVRLSLRSASGKQLQEKAVYSVSTSPALVIVRTES